MGRRGGPKKVKAPVKKYDLIVAEGKGKDGTKEGSEVYLALDQAVEQYKHDTHRNGVWGAAWMIGQKKNRDGLLILGKMKRCTELEKQLHGYDGIVLLNQEAWRRMTAEQRMALMHHELCHVEPVMDNEGVEQVLNGHGHLRWRVRKHDIEEFAEVIAAHGLYKDDLRRFVGAAVKREGKNPSLFGPDPADAPPPPTPIPPTVTKAAPAGKGSRPHRVPPPPPAN